MSPPAGLRCDAWLQLDSGVGGSIIGAIVNCLIDGFQVGSTWNLTLRSMLRIIASGIVGGFGVLCGSAVIRAGPERSRASHHSCRRRYLRQER